MRALVLALLCTASAAADKNDVDDEVARRHFAAGQAHYAAHRYPEAIQEFEAARRIKPLPAFDYNIGRCYDLSEQWRAAADAYERYLAVSPKDREAAKLRERIKILRERAQAMEVVAAPVAVVPPTPPPAIVEPPPAVTKSGAEKPAHRPLVRRPWFWATIAGAVVVAGVAVGLGVGLGTNRDPAATYGRVFGD